MKNLEQLIANIIFQLRMNAILKATIVGLGFSLIGSGFGVDRVWILAMGILALFCSLIGLGTFKNQRNRAKKILHRHFGYLEFSLELLDKPERNIAEELQLLRISKQSQQGKLPKVFTQSLMPFLVFLLVSGGIFGMGMFSSNNESKSIHAIESAAMGPKNVAEKLPLTLKKIEIIISPPAYTGEKSITQKNLNIKALEGSTISWNLNFSAMESFDVVLIDAGGKKVSFENEGTDYTLTDRVTGSGIYAIKAYDRDSLIFESEWHTLEALLDKSPVIMPEEKEMYRYHFHKDPKKHAVEARISDEYLVQQTFLVATLARGSGENVKFRENKIPLPPKNFKNANISHQLDLEAMDFKPGDELYYYWLAIDNKQPESNISKSDTYFIQYVDSAGLTESQLEGMAIHVLPEYFRSQRQIIIDTEKLIAENKKLEEETFNQSSNELGQEQKLLRMRYGQYLGEEYESNAPGGLLDTEAVTDLLESFKHIHDHEGEHDHDHQDHEENTIQLPDEQQHDHDHGKDQGEDNELASLLESYLHNHDSEDANTFYEQSTRNILKMALEQMWESELHLRLYEPEKALPYQKQALEYLKSVQQKSRVYVKRTGFDPPPIKETEKRLTGDVSDISQIATGKIAVQQNELALLASELLGFLNQGQLNDSHKETIQNFGNLWTERMENSGMQDWNTLLWVQKLGSGKLNEKESEQLYQKLIQVVNSERQTNPQRKFNKELAKAFWENLK